MGSVTKAERGNLHATQRLPSTKNWGSPWQNHLQNRYVMWKQGGLVPPYSSLTDPYCAKFASSLYGTKAFVEPAENESMHDFYKRREEESSNTYQRARRRSIELIEQVIYLLYKS